MRGCGEKIRTKRNTTKRRTDNRLPACLFLSSARSPARSFASRKKPNGVGVGLAERRNNERISKLKLCDATKSQSGKRLFLHPLHLSFSVESRLQSSEQAYESTDRSRRQRKNEAERKTLPNIHLSRSGIREMLPHASKLAQAHTKTHIFSSIPLLIVLLGVILLRLLRFHTSQVSLEEAELRNILASKMLKVSHIPSTAAAAAAAIVVVFIFVVRLVVVYSLLLLL